MNCKGWFYKLGDVQKGRQFYDVEGKELPGAPGYKYYGAAKDLPGVRELFAEKDEEAEIHKQKRCDFFNIPQLSIAF